MANGFPIAEFCPPECTILTRIRDSHTNIWQPEGAKCGQHDHDHHVSMAVCLKPRHSLEQINLVFWRTKAVLGGPVRASNAYWLRGEERIFAGRFRSVFEGRCRKALVHNIHRLTHPQEVTSIVSGPLRS
jgi:hypothetical protein